MSWTVNHTLTYGPKTKLWAKQIYDSHIFTSIKLQNSCPTEAGILVLVYFSIQRIWFSKIQRQTSQSASDLTAHNSCTISSDSSKTPSPFHLFGPSTSPKYHKFLTGNTATFHNFSQRRLKMSGYWLLLFIVHNFPWRYGGFVSTP